MTVPPASTSAFEVKRALLESARFDSPSEGTVKRARLAVLVAASSGASAGMAAAGASGTMALKWLGLGLVLGAVAGAAVTSVRRPPDLQVLSSAMSADSSASTKPPPEAELETTSQALSRSSRTSASRLAPDAQRVVAGSRAAVAAPTSPSSTSALMIADPPLALSGTGPPVPAHSARASLSQELAFLDQARQLIELRRGSQALGVLDRYQQDYPAGRLGHEAALLRVQALLIEGNQITARELGMEFLRNNPGSPLAARIRALLGTH